MSRKYTGHTNPLAVLINGSLTGLTPKLVVPESKTMESCVVVNLDGAKTIYVGVDNTVTGPSGLNPGVPVAPGTAFSDTSTSGPWYFVCDDASTPKYSGLIIG